MEREEGKVPAYYKYVDDNLVDNRDDAFLIAEIATEETFKNFDIKPESPEMILGTFSVIFKTFIDKLIEKRNAGYSAYKIVIADRLELGFDNSDGDEWEKQGNFTPKMEHLYHESKDDSSEREFEDNAITLCNTWQSVNITTDAKIIKEVASKSMKALKDVDIIVGSQEILMPIFCTVYDAIITYIKIKRAESKEFEFEINFMNLFLIKACESEDQDDYIQITPGIRSKRNLKSDERATAIHE